MTGRWFQVATSMGVRRTELEHGANVIRESMLYSGPPANRLQYSSEIETLFNCVERLLLKK